MTTLLATGCYTDDRGAGSGVRTWEWDPERRSARLVNEYRTASPSWVGWHPRLPVLYAVSEGEQSALIALSPQLEPLGEVDLGGADGCHLELADAHAVVTNYTSGSVSVVALSQAGVPTGRTDLHQLSGSGPDPGRQAGPHPHFTARLADGSLLITDLGSDRIHPATVDPAGALRPGVDIVLPAGTGPRHLAITTDQHNGFVSGELASTVTTLHRGPDGWWSAGPVVPASARASAGQNAPSHLQLTPDGRFLLVANRGADTVAVFDTTGDRPQLVAETGCGAWPRHLLLLGQTVIVSAERADQLTVLSFDPGTGAIDRVGEIATGTPTCVAARPRTPAGDGNAAGTL